MNKKVFFLLSLMIVLLSTLPHLLSLRAKPVIDDNLLIYDAPGRGCGPNPLDCFHDSIYHADQQLPGMPLKPLIFRFYYRPILSASFALGQKFHGPQLTPSAQPEADTRVFWFHVENILLHAVVVGLAICLFRLLFRRRITALVAGLLFGIHPLQVTITTFIGGRTDTIALFFVFLFAISLRKAGDLNSLSLRISRALRQRDRFPYPSRESLPALHQRDRFPYPSRESLPLDRRRARLRLASMLWILFSLLAFLGALFTKEQVFVLAALVPMLAAPHFRRRKAVRTPFPLWSLLYLLPIGIYGRAMHAATSEVIMPHADWTRRLHVEMIGRTLWYFTKTLFFPTLSTQHMSTLGPWDIPQYGVALLGYGAAFLWLGLLFRTWSDRPMRILMLWVTLTMASCINIIPIPSQFASPYRAAIPLFGVAGIVAAFLTTSVFTTSVLTTPVSLKQSHPRLSRIPAQRFQIARWVQIALLVATTLWCLFVTLTDIPYWHDETQLMIAEVGADPNFLPARGALAADYVKDLKKLDFQASQREYDACLAQIFGTAPESDYPILLQTPQVDRLMKSASSLRYDASWILDVIRGRAWMLEYQGKYAEAIPDFRTLLIVYNSNRKSVNPDEDQSRQGLRYCYQQTGQQDKADAVARREDVMTGRPP